MPVCLLTGEGHDTRVYNKAIFRDERTEEDGGEKGEGDQ